MQVNTQDLVQGSMGPSMQAAAGTEATPTPVAMSALAQGVIAGAGIALLPPVFTTVATLHAGKAVVRMLPCPRLPSLSWWQ